MQASAGLEDGERNTRLDIVEFEAGVVVPTNLGYHKAAAGTTKPRIWHWILVTVVLCVAYVAAAELWLLRLGAPLAPPIQLAKFFAAVATVRLAAGVRLAASFLQAPVRLSSAALALAAEALRLSPTHAITNFAREGFASVSVAACVGAIVMTSVALVRGAVGGVVTGVRLPLRNWRRWRRLVELRRERARLEAMAKAAAAELAAEAEAAQLAAAAAAEALRVRLEAEAEATRLKREREQVEALAEAAFWTMLTGELLAPSDGFRWLVVACGGLWWLVMACDGLWWLVVACGGIW